MDFAAASDAAGAVVRRLAGDGVRAWVGEREANDILLAVAEGRIRRVFLQADPARLKRIGLVH